VVIFLAGNLLQLQSHWILGGLQHAGSKPGDPTVGPYRIPRGGAFELVSCPHYLAEILIYAGLVLLLGRANGLVWLIFAWVVSVFSLHFQSSRLHANISNE
jgi:3-oxo-5-alpha-steroid 4-dehydrogenase 3